ncbi:MAG: sigma-70 family RNA polymerase sigma factor [Muribaculaceae bacterium]|nr:sigma-70 family RNA polymerase sigma factor [Muribaculaceae bacterium]
MPTNFQEIANQWYEKMRLPFFNLMISRFPRLRGGEIEDIYQNIFIAIQENFEKGRIKDNTSWYSYIMTVGYNLACKHMRHADITDSYDGFDDNHDRPTTLDRIKAINLELQEEDISLFDNPEADIVLGEEIARTPEPCATILRLFYYERMPLANIAEVIGFNSARSVQSRRWQCVRNLISPVKAALKRAGIII